MSDFLTNLVMRSFAQTPSVQPMTLSTYAAREPVENFVEPVQKTEVVKNADESESVMEEAPVVAEAPEAPLVTETPPKVVPVAAPQNDVATPEVHFENSEVQPPPQPTQKSAVPPPAKARQKPRVMSKPDRTIAPPSPPKQRDAKPAVQVHKAAEPLIVEQVIEHVVERPTVRTIERPTVKMVERPTIKTIEESTIKTVERPSITSIERSTVTIENTEHVTNSFTTLVPKVTPPSLPAVNLRPRQTPRPAELPDEEQEQTPAPSPENVINVAIGRIEVRATPAPTSRRERQQHGPKVMTLDDYMQQRSRGTQ